MANLDLEQIITTPGAADSAPAGAEKINSNFAKVEAAIPVNTSELTNDSGFITNAVSNLANYYTKTQTYTKEEVNSLVGQLVQIQVVSSLPQSGQANTIYLVPSGGSQPDVYDEYVWVNRAWEQIGNTEVDLSNYLQKTGDASDTTVTFVSESGDPTSGSKLSSIVGRLVKKLSDIVSGAISVAKATSADTATRATQDGQGNNISETYATRGEIPASLPPSGEAGGDLKGSYPNPLVKQVTGEYTGSTSGYGGWNPPANFPKQKIQWRMMGANLKNKTLPFTNWMIMDPYSGSDVNYLSGIGVTREATPRAFIVSGVRGGTEASDWSDSLELATQNWVTGKLPSVYVDTVPTNPKDGDILITTTD